MCLICERIQNIRENKNPYLIHEFKHSFFVVGDHQYFKGYCLLIMKDHYEDLTDIERVAQLEYMEEVLLAGKFLKDYYKPVRMNYSCLGNFVPHVHYHLFPRYQEDLAKDETKNPWHCIDRFDEFKLQQDQASKLAEELKLAFNDFNKISL